MLNQNPEASFRIHPHRHGGALGRGVLVVDADAGWRARLTRVLHDEGYRVAGAGTNRQVIAALRGENPPEAVLIGSEVEGGPVHDLLDEILTVDPRLTILLSAPQSSHWADFSSWRADECLPKSSDPALLKQKLAQALDRRRSATRAA